MVVWGVGVFGLGSWIGFVGLGFSVNGLLGLLCEAMFDWQGGKLHDSFTISKPVWLFLSLGINGTLEMLNETSTDSYMYSTGMNLTNVSCAGRSMTENGGKYC